MNHHRPAASNNTKMMATPNANASVLENVLKPGTSERALEVKIPKAGGDVKTEGCAVERATDMPYR